MAFTKRFKNAASGTISATYLSAGDRVRLVKFAPLSAAQLKHEGRDLVSILKNPAVGMLGTVALIRNLPGGASYIVVDWDDDKPGLLYYPFVRENTGDVIELA